MRIILYTGKGGVGKTSVAAASAVKSAESGLKTLIVSTDPAHSLGDSFDIKLSPEPNEIEDNLWAQEIDTIHEVEKGWGQIQKYLTSLFTAKTIKDITTEELTIFPGFQDLLSLVRILKYYQEQTFDVIIIDSAPTGETLAFLSFPDMLRWWMDKLFPIKRKAVKFIRPVAQPILGVPMPTDNVLGEIENIYSQLDEMRKLFADKDVSSIRVVVNPEKMVIKEAQRSFTYLNIYNFNVDAVIINRVIPNSVTDSYFSLWKDIQEKYTDEIKNNFSPIPIYYAPLFEQEVVGTDMLRRMGDEIFQGENPIDIKYSVRTQEIIKDGDEYVFSIYMPFINKKDLTLNQKGDELIVKVGNVKRNITLPRTLASFAVMGAKFSEEKLQIRFGVREDV